MRFGIVGGGWYSSHIALVLSREGHEVEIFEKNSDIFQGVSGNFGIRLHKGPHYPRSKATRQSCHETFTRFLEVYPDLVVPHEYSVYALGEVDALGYPARVSPDTFRQVCQESPECKEIRQEDFGYQNLQLAMILNEPSIVLGSRLRESFRKKLNNANILVHCNTPVAGLQSFGQQVSLTCSDGIEHHFDKVINTTGFQSIIPKDLKQCFPVDMEVVYQPCIALCYQDKTPSGKPISFIVMDGWFPCLMPYVDAEPFAHQYIMTHGCFTIMASCASHEEASAILSDLQDETVTTTIKRETEREMLRFWPEFKDRFHYIGWKGAVLAKIKTETEFRSGVTFEYQNVIYGFPGKVSNIFNFEDEVIRLIYNQHCISRNGVRYVSGGILDLAQQEIATKPAPGVPNTCTLNTLQQLSFLGTRKPSDEEPQRGQQFFVSHY